MSFGFVAEGEARRVRVAIPGYGTLLPLTMSRDKGYYQQEGLEVEFIVMGATLGIQALIAGEVDFAGAAGPALSAAVRGAPARVVFTAVDRPMHWLMVKPGIRAVRELKRKKVAITSIGSTQDFFLRDLLSRYGLRGGQDVVFLSMGPNPRRYTALVTGAVDASMLASPFNFRAEEAGFHELVAFIKEKGYGELQGSMSTTEKLLKSDPGLVQKFVRATLKGLLHVRQSRSDSIARLADDLKLKEALAAKAYDVIRPAMTSDGTPNEEAKNNYFQILLKAFGRKDLPSLESFLRYSFVRKAHAELKAEGWRPGR